MKIISYHPFETLKWSLKICVCTLLLVYLIGVRYFTQIPMPDSPLGYSYLVTAYIGHFGFLAMLFWVFTSLPICIVSPHKNLSKALILIANILIIVLVTIDTFVFQQYRFHLNLFIWNLVINDRNGEIFAFSWTMKAIAIVAILTVVAVFAWLAKYFSTHQKSWPIKRGAGALFFVYLIANLIHTWADAQYIQSITRYNQSLPIYYPATATKFMDKHGWLNKEAQQANASLSMDDKNSSILYPLKPIKQSLPESPFNIVIIAIDSWRSDEMNAQVSPNMWSFSEQSIRYEDHYSGSNSTRTGIFSLFYGLPGVYWNAMFANKQGPVFIDTLLQSGYQLGIFASAVLTNPEFDRTVFRSVDNLRVHSDGGSPIARDQDLTNDWLDWIEQQQSNEQPKPFFSFLFYDAPHGYSRDPNMPAPFQPESEMNYLKLSSEYDSTQVRNRYRNAVYQNDILIGKVLDDLKDRDLLDKTVVLITADHGQEFNDNNHNYWGHGSNFSPAQTHVPMILHWPGKEHEVISQQTTHFDVVPSLMRDVLGVTSPDTDYASGGNLLSPSPRSWRIAGSYRDFAVIEEAQITVSGFDGSMKVYRHNMDPVESPNLNLKHLKAAMDELNRFYR